MPYTPTFSPATRLRLPPLSTAPIADGKTKVYGDADPSLTYQVSGLKNGDTAGAVLNGGSLSRVAGETTT